MSILRLAVTSSALVIAVGCADGRTVVDPSTPQLSGEARSSDLAREPARRVQASGEFDALVDFTTITFTPRGRNCLLQVNGTLVFTGTIDGEATGRTSALVFAPCSAVMTTPPGTFRDVFKSELVFKGTVDGVPACANLLYMGGVQPGGHIDGRLIFSNGVQGRLNADAQVAVGGTYDGSVVFKRCEDISSSA